MDDPSKIVEYETQTQNGLDKVRIVSCRSLAGDEKKLFINSSENQSLGDGTCSDNSTLSDITPKRRLENEFSHSDQVVLCSNVSSSAGRLLHTYSNTSKTAEISSNCDINRVVQTSISQMEKEKASTAILSATNKKKREHINSVTKNHFSSRISPVAVDISKVEACSVCFTKNQETSPSDTSVSLVVTSISNGQAHATKSVLMSITDLCNRLPNLPPEHQASQTTPRQPSLQAQGLLLKTQHENTQYKQVPGRRLSYENPPTQQINYARQTQLEMGEISQRNTKTTKSDKEQNYLSRNTYQILQSPLLYRERPESFLSYQDESSCEVGNKKFYHYRTQGNLLAQPSGISKQDVETSYAGEQDETQQEVVIDSKRLKLSKSVSKEIGQHSNDMPPSNDLYYINQVYRGGQQNLKVFDGVGGFYYPIQTYDTQNFSTNVYYPSYDGMYERGVYAVTNDSANYPGYQNYSDYDPNCDCEQCYQAASYYSMNLHRVTDIGGWDHPWVDNSRLSPCRDNIMSDDYFPNTLFSDAYNEMSSLIPGKCKTTAQPLQA